MTALLRWYATLALVAAMFVFFAALMLGVVHAQTCKESRYERDTLRCDDGLVWKKDRYGYQTWRSNKGEVWSKDRYGGRWRGTGRKERYDR